MADDLWVSTSKSEIVVVRSVMVVDWLSIKWYSGEMGIQRHLHVPTFDCVLTPALLSLMPSFTRMSGRLFRFCGSDPKHGQIRRHYDLHYPWCHVRPRVWTWA